MDFSDKIVKIEYTSIKEQISNILKNFTKIFDELKKFDFNLDTIIQKLSGTFENNLNLFDANEFTKIFDGFLSKIDEAKENLIISIKGKRDFYLSKLSEEINGLTEKIKGRLEGYDLISTLKNNANTIIEFIKDKIGIFNKKEILNKNGIAGSQENIINKLSQIPIINSISKLNSSLTNIKNDIIDKIKNTEENMNKLRQHISSLFTELFNINSLPKKMKITLTKIPLMNNIYQVFTNANEFLANLIISTNISDFTNTTKMKEIISNLKKDIKANVTNIQQQFKDFFNSFERGFEDFQNEFISLAEDNLDEAKADVESKLVDAKIGDIPQIAIDFFNHLKQNFSIMYNMNLREITNENFIAFKDEIISFLSKFKDKIEENEGVQQFLSKLKNPFSEKLNEMKNSTLKNLIDIKLSEIKEFIEGIEEDEDNMNNLKTLTEKVSYLLNKYYFENNRIQNITEGIFNKTILNEIITNGISIISIIEKFQGMGFKNSSEIYDESVEIIKDILKGANTSNIYRK